MNFIDRLISFMPIKNRYFSLLVFVYLQIHMPMPAIAETLVYISDDGSRLEATDEPCRTFSKYTFFEGAYEFRYLKKGVVVSSKGCWVWDSYNTRLHFKYSNYEELFLPAEIFKPVKEAEALFAKRVEERQAKADDEAKEREHKEYIESIFARAEAAKRKEAAERIAKEDASKPKTWIAHNKFGSVILTQAPCSKKTGGSIAYMRSLDNSTTKACWGWQDGNILVRTDTKDYMYTPSEFVLQSNH